MLNEMLKINFKQFRTTRQKSSRGLKKFTMPSIDYQSFDLRPPPVHLVNLYHQPKINSNLRNAKKSTRKPQQTPKVMDLQVVQAVQQPNQKFVIEKFVYVPSRDVDELKAADSIAIPRIGKIPMKKFKKIQNIKEDVNDRVKVESIGMSSADQPIPDYSAFFPSTFSRNQVNETTLILEPNSRALSGNRGTSISSPLSRAILRPGTSVKVLYRPQSVAITGANGIAHAQSDLLLDFIEDDERVDDAKK